MFTMDAADAAYALRELIKPKFAMPMHYRTVPGVKPPPQLLAEELALTPVKVLVLQPGEAVQF
jgi:L-ascorbate metabolism protein UlaG (beta-lactamase superfamily)